MGDALLRRRMSGKKYIYKAGDECSALTGGWGKYGAHGGWTVTAGIKSSDHFTVGPGSATDAKMILLGTIRMIDLAKFKTISVDYVKKALGTNADSYKLKLCVSTANTDPVVSTGVVASVLLNAAVSTSHITATLDVSALTSSYYIWVQSSSPDVGDVYSVSMK